MKKEAVVEKNAIYTAPAKQHGPRRMRRGALLAATVVLGLTFVATASAEDNDSNVPFLPTPVRSVSTKPANGDQNPYGVAFVPRGFAKGGVLQPGDVLVSNFNNAGNLQGTGTTIIRVPTAGAPTLFFQGQAPLGLSTALNILKAGFVLVGNFPTADGTPATAQPGSILVIDSKGNKVSEIANSTFINGPWGSALHDQGDHAKFFVANVLSGTIVRLDLKVGPKGVTLENSTQIASGYMHRGDPAALEIGPTGLVYDPHRDVLYVASSEDNKIFAVNDAGDTTHDHGTGRVIYDDPTHLHGALAMTMAPNGHLLVTNNDVINGDPNQPSEIVEFTVEGKFISEIPVDPAQGGAFGLATAVIGDDVAQLAAVDDNTATLTIWTLPLP